MSQSLETRSWQVAVVTIVIWVIWSWYLLFSFLGSWSLSLEHLDVDIEFFCRGRLLRGAAPGLEVLAAIFSSIEIHLHPSRISSALRAIRSLSILKYPFPTLSLAFVSNNPNVI